MLGVTCLKPERQANYRNFNDKSEKLAGRVLSFWTEAGLPEE